MRGLLASLAVLLVGCGHVETHQAMFRPAEAATGRAVELYLSDQQIPARPFYEIGLVEAIGFGNQAHPEDVADALVAKAAGLGCDAVVRTYIDQGYTRTHAAGVCVKWLGPASSTAPAESTKVPASHPLQPEVRPTPAPRIEPLPSAGPAGGGGK